jgi:hypothetical protein
LAGFSPGRCQYFVPRSTLIPSEELQKQIFPQLNAFIGKENELDSLSAYVFLELLTYLRVVILQDAASSPEVVCKLTNLSVFRCPEFLQFVDQMQNHLRTQADPEITILQRTVPIISDQLRLISTTTSQNHAAITAMIDSLKAVDQRIQKLEQTGFTFQITASRSVPAEVSSGSIESQIPQEISNSLFAAPRTIPVQTVFDLPASLSTIQEVWKEWHEGLAPDYTSIKFLDETQGSNWRKKKRGKGVQ